MGAQLCTPKGHAQNPPTARGSTPLTASGQAARGPAASHDDDDDSSSAADSDGSEISLENGPAYHPQFKAKPSPAAAAAAAGGKDTAESFQLDSLAAASSPGSSVQGDGPFPSPLLKHLPKGPVRSGRSSMADDGGPSIGPYIFTKSPSGRASTVANEGRNSIGAKSGGRRSVSFDCDSPPGSPTLNNNGARRSGAAMTSQEFGVFSEGRGSRGSSSVPSQRSSFARERISIDIFPPSRKVSSSKDSNGMNNMPPALLHQSNALVIIPPNTPVPLPMLLHLWGLPSLAVTHKMAEDLALCSLLRMVQLEDGSTWCLVSEDHCNVVPESGEGGNVFALERPYHMALLDSYTCKGTKPLHMVPDDGYLMQHVAYHLAGAGRLTELLALLQEPLWLEAKLHNYGVSAIVADFRKYLQLVEEGSDGKLLLQAFQLSLTAASDNPTCHVLRDQMLARLMTVAQTGSLKQWYHAQLAQLAADREVLAAQGVAVHLMPRTATLQQAGGLHRLTLRGHTGAVRRIVISPNGQDVITIGDDGKAQVFDMNIGDCVMQLTRSTALTAVTVTPDGLLCFMAGADGDCALWELSTGQIKHVFEGHTAKVNAVAVDRKGRICASASDDASVRLWSIEEGSCLYELRGHGSVSSSALGVVHDVVFSWDCTLLASASNDCTVRVWDLEAGAACRHVLEGHVGGVMSVQFIGSSSQVVSASHDATARVWDAKTGMCLHILAGHAGPVNKVSVCGARVLTSSDDATARVWNATNGACVAVLEGHEGWVSDAVITRDGGKVMTGSGDSTCAVWDVSSGRCETVLQGHSAAIVSVALTFKGRFAVTASDDCTARVWDLQATSTNLLPPHEGKVKSIQALGNGERVVSVAEDGKALVWDVMQGTVSLIIEGHDSPISFLATQDDGATFVTGSGNRQMCQWSTMDGTAVHAVPAQQGYRAKHMAVDGKGTTAVLVLSDSTLSVWDLCTGECKQQLMKHGDRDETRVHSGPINAVLLSRDGKTAVSISRDCTARVWDVEAAACRLVIRGHQDSVVSVALSQDEAMLATGAEDSMIQIITMADGAVVAALEHPGPVTFLAFSPSGQYLAALVEARRVVVWDLQQRGCCGAFAGHQADINGIVFSPDSELLATYANCCTVRVFRAGSGELVALFVADDAITSVCFCGSHATAYVLAVGDVRGIVHFLDLPQHKAA